MTDSKPLIDPKELVPAYAGFAVGIGIIVFFVLLATALGLTLFVDRSDIPMQ